MSIRRTLRKGEAANEDALMRRIIWVGIAVYAVAMGGVAFSAKQIVGNFGVLGGLATIAAMYGAARYYERRRR
jgi:hypothetical protein